MKRTVSIVILLTMTIWGYGVLAGDENVAVLKTSYINLNSGTEDETASMEFHTALLDGIEDAGFSVTSGEMVATAVSDHSFDGDCDRTCLNAVRSELGVREVVRVQVREDDTGIAMRSVAVTFAVRDDISRETSDGYEVVKTWLSGAVALALKEDVPTSETASEPTLMPDTSPVDSRPAVDGTSDGSEGETTVATMEDRPRRRLSPIPLIVSASLTVAFGATAIVMDSLAHSNFQDLDKDIDSAVIDGDDRSTFDEKSDTVRNQQLMLKIFLGAAAAGLVTTGVLAVFTDFSGSKKESVGLKPAFAVGKNSGALIIGGRF